MSHIVVSPGGFRVGDRGFDYPLFSGERGGLGASHVIWQRGKGHEVPTMLLAFFFSCPELSEDAG